MAASFKALVLFFSLVAVTQVSGDLKGPRNQYVLEGSNVNFTCSTTDVEAGLKWYLYHGGNITQIQAVSYHKNESLFSSTVSLKNVGVSYDLIGVECSTDRDGYYFGITVVPREDIPIITPTNQTLISAEAGDRAELHCATAEGEHIFMWSRDGCLLQEDQGVTNSTFVIPVITEWDGGVYTCAVRKEKYLQYASHVMVDKQEYQVSVTMSLVTDVPESGTTLDVPQGTDAYMYCGIAGYPLDILWTRNDEDTSSVLSEIYEWKPQRRETCELEINLGPTYGVQNRGRTLVIRDFTLSDEGAYVCRGKQEDRELQHKFVLKLAGDHLTARKGVLLVSLLAFCMQYFI